MNEELMTFVAEVRWPGRGPDGDWMWTGIVIDDSHVWTDEDAKHLLLATLRPYGTDVEIRNVGRCEDVMRLAQLDLLGHCCEYRVFR